MIDDADRRKNFRIIQTAIPVSANVHGDARRFSMAYVLVSYPYDGRQAGFGGIVDVTRLGVDKEVRRALAVRVVTHGERLTLRVAQAFLEVDDELYLGWRRRANVNGAGSAAPPPDPDAAIGTALEEALTRAFTKAAEAPAKDGARAGRLELLAGKDGN